MVGPFIEMENIEWGGAGLGGYGIRKLVLDLLNLRFLLDI